MKKYIISFILFLVGLYCGFLIFNFIDAWIGNFFTVSVIGGYIYYIYKQVLKLHDNEKFN